MALEVREVAGRKARTEFVSLPARVHRDHPGWVPPLLSEELRFLDARKNPAHAYCECLPLMAFRDGQAVGRAVGIVNHRYNRLRGIRTARFGQLECVDDQAVAHSLLALLERWACRQGMTALVGPAGLTDQDPEGLLVEGFEEEPALASYQNREYVARLLETEGYRKEVDYVVYRVPVPAVTPAVYRRIVARARASPTIRLIEFGRRRELTRYVRPTLELMNEAFRDLSGFVPLDDTEIRDLERRFFSLIDPRFVKVVLARERIVGFVVGIPNINPGLRRAKGRLLPFGWYHLLRARHRSDRLDLLIGAVREGYRGRGVDALMGEAMFRSARAAGFAYLDSHHELESNHRVRREMERVGGVVYKRYRIFGKSLDTRSQSTDRRDRQR